MLLLKRTSGNLCGSLSLYVGSWIKGSLHFAHRKLLKRFLLNISTLEMKIGSSECGNC